MTVVASLGKVGEALSSADALASEGISIGVLDPGTLIPLVLRRIVPD